MLVAFSAMLFSLFLIFMEFFVPGGILGVIGGLGLLMSAYLFFLEEPDLLMTIVYFACMILGIWITVRFALFKIKNSKNTGVYSDDDQEGFVASEFEKLIIGQDALVVSDLKPSGFIQIENKRYQALSTSGYIPKGAIVTVNSGEGGHVKVSLKTK